MGLVSQLNPKVEVRFGVAGFTVSDFANDNSFDYVIAGMRDNHSIIEKLLGTTSTIITKMTSCPVILVHENTRFTPIQKIIFAIDDSHDFDESITDFLKFNKIYKAHTDFIHVKVDSESMDSTKTEIIKEIFKINEPTFSFSIKTINGGDIVQSIVDYAIFEKADLVTLVHRKRSFLGSLFERSVSLKTAEGIHLPILIIEENPSK